MQYCSVGLVAEGAEYPALRFVRGPQERERLVGMGGHHDPVKVRSLTRGENHNNAIATPNHLRDGRSQPDMWAQALEQPSDIAVTAPRYGAPLGSVFEIEQAVVGEKT